MSYIISSSISILINGSNSEYFLCSRGIRQGDPISPYIFIICIERLSKEIDKAVFNKVWVPISISTSGPIFPYLFSDDDPTLFFTAITHSCNAILGTLNNIYRASSEKLNNIKSKTVFSNNATSSTISTCATNMNIQASDTFEKYLGFPIFHSMPKHRELQYIINNMQTRLNDWKTSSSAWLAV